MNDFISASHDVVFKALFVRNQDVLKAFLNDSLDLNLTDADSIKVMSSEDVPDAANGKFSRFDVHVRTANRRYNVEMQAQKSGFSSERVLYYWSKLYGDGFESGSKYEELDQTYSVNVLGFNYFNCKDYHSSFSILENERHELLTDKLSIHVFELPKVPKELISGDRVQEWMEIIKAESEEALDIVRKRTENPMINKAIDAICQLNADEKLREQIRVQQKAEYDYGNDMAVARDEGRAEGLMEGRLETLKENAANMRVEGLDDETIARILRVNVADVRIWLDSEEK
ncbi:MAG: Rpn family recombination-promoting nuclease/putative transposase [Thermoguttaceae bacterium]|nr:Rpn family recombination-promoting nuclease/putative transposase [Thermoguttaceae bacterium]